MFKERLYALKGNKIFLHGALFSLYSFINRGFVFLLLLILANYISPAEYGYLSLFSTVIMILGFFICFSSEGYMTVSYFQEGNDSLKYTYSTILWVGLLMTTFFVIILFLGGAPLRRTLNLPQDILYIGVFVSLFTALANVNLDYFRLKENITLYGVFSCGNALLNFVGSILLVKTFMFGWEGRVYAQLCCALIFASISVVFFARKKYLTLDIKKWIKPIFRWSLPLIPMHATTFMRQGFDRYIINYSHTIVDVGLFSFALNISNVITMIGFGFNQSFGVDIYRILGDKLISSDQKKDIIIRMTFRLLLLFLLTTIIVTIACYTAIPFLLPKYAEAMDYFLILSIYAFFVCYYLVFTNILFFYKKTKIIMYISVSSSLFHLILSLLLTKYSLFLTCIVYCISQAVFAIGVHYFANKELKHQLA